jgi:hypothetical protein
VRAWIVLGVVAAALVAVAAAWGATDPNSPRQRHTLVDTRLAKALALRRGDLAAGWTATQEPTDGPPCTASPDESDLVQTARVDPSFTWKDGVTTLGSEVDIFRSVREAQKDWRLSTLALMKECLLQGARSGLGQGARVSVVAASALTPPSVGVERAVHYRIQFAVRSKQRTLSLVSDVIGLGRGRITVVLHTLTVARPLPAAALSPLVETLAARLNGGRQGA